jgi:hypothetical protein
MGANLLCRGREITGKNMLDIVEFRSALLLKTNTAGTRSAYMRSADAFVGPPVVGCPIY